VAPLEQLQELVPTNRAQKQAVFKPVQQPHEALLAPQHEDVGAAAAAAVMTRAAALGA
jgi:hypothetical protein